MRRGFAPIIAIAVVAAFLVGIGATVAYFKIKNQPTLVTKIIYPYEKPQSAIPSPLLTKRFTLKKEVQIGKHIHQPFPNTRFVIRT